MRRSLGTRIAIWLEYHGPPVLFAVVVGLIALLALVGVLVIVGALAGCSAAAKPLVTTRVVVEPKLILCATTAPPPRRVPVPTCDATACRFVLVDAAALLDYLEALTSWATTTWLLCSPPATQPIGAP